MQNDAARVLLLSEDEATRDLIVAAAGNIFALKEVRTVAEALQNMGAEECDAVLAEFNPAGRDDWKLLRAARASHTPIPIIVVSGDTRHASRAEAMQAGAADFLTRSGLSQPLLENSILCALERARAAAKSANFETLCAIFDVVGGDIGITLSNTEGLFEIYNATMTAITGYTKEEANDRSRDFLRALSPTAADYETAVAGIKEALARHIWRNVGTAMRAKDGSLKKVLVSTIAIPYCGDTWLLSAYHDITDNMAEELAGAKRRLEETVTKLTVAQQTMLSQDRLSKLGEISSGVAHDFNNSLMTIRGYADLALVWLLDLPLAPAATAKFKEALEIILKAADAAQSSTKLLRSFYKPAETVAQGANLAVNTLIEAAISISRMRWRGEASGKNVKIEFRRELGAVPDIPGNQGELEQVLVNLIFNATDAIVEKAAKNARADAPPTGCITLRSKPDLNTEGVVTGVLIEVEDNGVGMAAKLLEKPPEPFHTTKPGGTGIGLWLANLIVKERHKGALTIQSKEGEWTRISLRLPLKPTGAATCTGSGLQ